MFKAHCCTLTANNVRAVEADRPNPAIADLTLVISFPVASVRCIAPLFMREAPNILLATASLPNDPTTILSRVANLLAMPARTKVCERDLVATIRRYTIVALTNDELFDLMAPKIRLVVAISVIVPVFDLTAVKIFCAVP